MTSPLHSDVAPALEREQKQEARAHWPVIARVAGSVLLYKLCFFAWIWALIRWQPTLWSEGSFALHRVNDALVSPGLWRYFETWDAHHYLHLARNGYGDSAMSLAFYPLWPFLVRAFAPLCGGNITLSALVLANAFSLLALVGLHRLVARRYGEPSAHRSLILLLAFPGALFFCFPFTESLFLMLCVTLFWLLELSDANAPDALGRQLQWAKWAPLLVALCAAGAAFGRPTGLLLSVPLAWVAWRRREQWVWGVVALSPLLGIAGYFLVIFCATGDMAAGLKAQQFFSSKPAIGLLFDAPGFVRGFFDLNPARGARAIIYDRAWFLLYAATLWPLWKRDKTWFAFALVLGIFCAMTVSMMSFMRYVSVLFPCFVVAALAFGGPRARLVFPFVVALLLLFQSFFLLLHINYFWAA